jgi:hypothetical protein
MDAMGHMEIAEGGLLKSLDNIQRIRELMVQGLNGTNGVEEKNMLQREINGIVDSQLSINRDTRVNMFINPAAKTAPFYYYDAILDVNFTLDLGPPLVWEGINYQLGENETDLKNVNFLNYSSGLLSVSPGQIALVSPSNLENTLFRYKIPGATVQPLVGDGSPNDTDDLTDLDNAIKNISRSISIVGALKSHFEEKFKYLDDKKIASKTSLSHYQDTDFALETSEFTQAKIKQQTASSMLSQSNAQAQLALTLLP